MADLPAHPAHSPALGHHFENLEQQHKANVLGMWTFLVTELMFFGGLFAAFILFRTLYLEAFSEASHHQNVMLGAINTAVLIGSSLTMALAVHAAQVSARRALMGFMAVTALLGCVFMGIKAYEYYDHIIHGLVPGAGFTSELDPRAALFFFLYFMMTGIHAVHLIIGIVILIVLIFRARSGRYDGASFTPIELMGMYWHFVDVVWVFLFPLLYLIGRH